MLREDFTNNIQFKQRPKGSEVFPKGGQTGSYLDRAFQVEGLAGQRFGDGKEPSIFKE